MPRHEGAQNPAGSRGEHRRIRLQRIVQLLL
uniref:Uncharacterized protein n=1 Tax=Physcomitrium patens TaxID=3218 RepID=A0A2K1L4L1_PHYPA|nr:hypothetical protein PHYPA_003772 [Physcomitrium patens]